MADRAAIRDLLAYILAEAGRADQWVEQDLGTIHLLKYLYLADWYAVQAGKPASTGITWRFHHFGPWSNEAMQLIEAELPRIGAERHTLDGQHGDFIRWRLRVSDEEYEDLRRRVAGAKVLLGQAIRKHRNVTETLLDDVYKTPPMLAAAPGAELQLVMPPADEGSEEADLAEPKRTQDPKKRAKRLQKAKEKMADVVAKWRREREEEEGAPADPAPRYDEVFHEGVRWLDSLAGEIEPCEGRLSVDDSVWSSPTRQQSRG